MKREPKYCTACERQLPRKAFRPLCATCIKRMQFMGKLFQAFKKGGAEEIVLGPLK